MSVLQQVGQPSVLMQLAQNPNLNSILSSTQSAPALLPGRSPLQLPSIPPSPVRQSLVVPPSPVRQSVALPPAPSPVRQLQFADQTGLVVQDAIERELLEHGYLVKEKILIDTPNGKVARYVRAYNKFGQPVLIELDVDGQLRPTEEDIVIREGVATTSVPYSVRMGAYECGKLDCRGMGFLCDDEVCVVERDESGFKPRERLFSVLPGQRGRLGKFGNTMLAHPIIRLSEIRCNGDQVLKNIDEVTRRVRNMAFGEMKCHIKQYEKELDKVKKELECFEKSAEADLCKLNKSLHELECLRQKYTCINLNDPCNQCNAEKYKILLFNLRRRHELALELLGATALVAQRRRRIEEDAKFIHETSVFLCQQFKCIDFVMHE